VKGAFLCCWSARLPPKKNLEKKTVVSHDMTPLMCPAFKTEEASCSNVFGLNLSLMMMLQQQSQWNPIK
jgi:hypothetical protein